MLFSTEHFKGNEKGAALIYRFFGVKLAQALRRTALTPNRLSYTGFGLGLLAALFYGMAGPTNLLWATVMYQLCIIVDYADGPLARFKNQTSHLGEWVEAVADPLREFFIIFGLCWGLYAQSGDQRVWILGFILGGTNYMMDILALTYEAFPFAGRDVNSLAGKSIIQTIARHLVSIRTTRYALIIPFALLDRLFAFLACFCLYNTLVFLLMTFKLGAEISRQDRLGAAEQTGRQSGPPNNEE